ncbi:MAG: hypothetical protein DI585_01780 [Pseudomonas fluorescens]|nr:MAG: hypothetical protein DI585_01780 [Pseudomonas fluorescens]
MLPSPSPMVKTTCRQLAQQQALIWGIFGLAALLLWLTGIDVTVAHALYIPGGTSFTGLMRESGTLPAAILALGALIAMFWPKLAQKRPTLYQTSAVLVLTLVLGCGLFNQIVVKNLADRPRPREAILTEMPSTVAIDGFRGNSMPSGHAAIGFVLAAPFFPLRRRHPRLAYGFLAAGLTAGTVIGLSRMMLGAHYATDVLIAGAIALSTASFFTVLMERITRIRPIYLALGTVVCLLAVILGNRFSNLTLTLPLTEPFTTLNLPCTPTAIPAEGHPTLTVQLSGYGAPLSQLKLINTNDIIKIRTSRGLYHHLTCTATLTQPMD